MVRKRKSIQTITDPILEPFFITKDKYSYTIKEKVTSNKDHFRSKGKNKTYEKSLFYYPNFSQAVQKIADLKSTTKDFSDINEFLKEYKIISNQIKEYTDGIRSTI